MEVLEHKEAPPAEPKRRTRRSRRADKKSLEQQGNWIEVTQAGCTFWVNDTTGIADEDPPPIRKPDGTFEPRKHTVDADADAEEVLDDEKRRVDAELRVPRRLEQGGEAQKVVSRV
ncbi:hypothetical protein JL721_7187 [Aureococcus anophagefferens]|nr:hypothetical protein JL721_7187 [Aureococcus anophagefferens]